MKSFVTRIKLSIIITFYTTAGFSQIGQQVKRVDSLKKQLELFNRTNKTPDSIVVYTLLDISTAYASVNKDSLLVYAQKALQKSSSKELHKATILSYRNVGFYYSDKGENAKALENYCLAISLCDAHNLPDLKPDLLRLIGDEYYFLGDFENSLNSLLEAVEIGNITRKENLLMLSIANKNIARLFLTQKDYTMALQFYDKAIEVNKALGSEGMKAITNANLAEIYTNMKRIETAKSLLTKSIDYFEGTQRKNWLGFCYRIKGLVQFEEGNYSESLKSLKKAENIFKDLDDDRESTKVLLDISTLMLKTNTSNEVENYIKRAHSKSVKLGDIHLIQRSLDLLHHIKKDSNPVLALRYLEKSKTLADSIFNTNNFRALNLYKAKLRYDEERKNLIATNELKVKEKNDVILYVSLLVFILLSTLILLYFKQKKLNSLNKALKQSEIELKNVNASKDMVFSILGHDLKGPIVALHLLMELYSENLEKKELSTYIPKLKSNVENILFTLTNLLNWGQSQLTGLTSKKELFDINEIINDNVNFLSELAILKDISIINVNQNSILINADKNQISLVVRNLLNNAIKFTEVGGSAIEIKTNKDKNFCIVSIIDKGIGIPKEKQGSLLNDEPNQPSKGTLREKGTGLGILISKKMVELNGGEMWFENSPKKGTIFYFSIPIR